MGHGTAQAEPRLSVRAMAEALGVAKSQVHRDAQAGMPMHSADAARAWRLDQHDMSRTVEGRIDRPASVRRSEVLSEFSPDGINGWHSGFVRQSDHFARYRKPEDPQWSVAVKVTGDATDAPPAAVSGLASAAGAGEVGTSPASSDAERGRLVDAAEAASGWPSPPSARCATRPSTCPRAWRRSAPSRPTRCVSSSSSTPSWRPSSALRRSPAAERTGRRR
jgi:hypothetical protein